MSMNLVGAVLGAYEILAPVGEGAMGSVYKARETLLQRIVAVKVIHRRFAGQREVADRFFREALIHSHLNHPNIIVIHTAGTAAGIPFIAMEFVDGGTLEAHMKSSGRLPARVAIEYAGQIAAAMDAAHAAGVVHRDLKPSNIMRTEHGALKLMDFGVARRAGGGLERLTTQGQILGTPAYMAPEQVLGDASDERSDVYSMGVMLYRMLSGRLPYEGPNAMSIMTKALTGDFEPMASAAPDTPEMLARIVDKALSLDPKNRQPGARNLKAEIDRAALEMDLAGFIV